MQKRKIENIPACLDKKTGAGGNFAAANEFRIFKVGNEIASCVCSRYYKGISAHHDNLVIVKLKNE